MKQNESWEIEISALLDAELSHGEILEVIDELVDSERNRGFYRAVRSLDRALLAGGELAKLPPNMWQKIEAVASAGDQPARSRWTSNWPLRMAASVAAAAVLVSAVWLLAPRSESMVATANPVSGRDVVNVSLAADQGRMTDERFIQITTELLQADPRYHQKMNEIMNAVAGRVMPSEGSGEGMRPLTDRNSGLLLTSSRPQSTWD